MSFISAHVLCKSVLALCLYQSLPNFTQKQTIFLNDVIKTIAASNAISRCSDACRLLFSTACIIPPLSPPSLLTHKQRKVSLGPACGDASRIHDVVRQLRQCGKSSIGHSAKRPGSHDNEQRARNACEIAFARCRAQPSAEIVCVESAKCAVRLCFGFAHATLCGDQGREMQVSLRFGLVARNYVRSLCRWAVAPMLV